MKIQAITFDFWDTLALDDSDEAHRAAAGLLPKPEARQALFLSELSAHAPHIGEDAAVRAWSDMLARFRHAWKVEHHPPSVATRLSWAMASLELSPTPGFDALVHDLERMEVEIPPAPIPGIVEALGVLAERHPLGIISDTVVTPGQGLREILASWGILHHFHTLIFSDEVGAAKPAPRVFQAAADGFGIDIGGLVHIGDRESNDIVGPQAVGARAVLCTASVDRGSAATAADAVFDSYAVLPAVIADLAAS